MTELEKIYDWIDDNFKAHTFTTADLNETLRESALKSIMPFFLESKVATTAIGNYVDSKPKELTRWGLMRGEALIMQDSRPQFNEGGLLDGDPENLAMTENEWLVIAGNWIGSQPDIDVNELYAPENDSPLQFEEIPMAFALEVQRAYDELPSDPSRSQLTELSNAAADMFSPSSNSPR